MESRFIVFMVFTFLGSLSGAEDEETNGSVSNENNSTSRTPLVGQYCWDQICPENQFCNEFFICECCEGYMNVKGYCVPCAREYESCDLINCCNRLTCVNNVCRKTMPSLQFASFAKICLAITATTITVAVLSLLLKVLLKFSHFDRFGQDSESSRVESYPRQIVNHRPPAYNAEQEKPPSYEECMNSAPSRIYCEPPPPYVISANIPENTVQNDSLESSNIRLPSNPEVISPLNVRALESLNSNVPQDVKSEKKLEEKGNS